MIALTAAGALGGRGGESAGQQPRALPAVSERRRATPAGAQPAAATALAPVPGPVPASEPAALPAPVPGGRATRTGPDHRPCS